MLKSALTDGTWKLIPANILRKLLKPIWLRDELVVMVAPLCTKPRTLPAELNYRLGNGEPQLLEKLCAAFPHKATVFRARFDNPDLDLFTCDYPFGTVAGFSWYSRTNYYEPQMDFTIPLEPGQVYQFDGFLAPPARKGTLALKFTYNMQFHFFQQGFKEALATVEARNHRNLKFHSFLGFRETGRKIVIDYFFGHPHTRIVTYQKRLLNPRDR